MSIWKDAVNALNDVGSSLGAVGRQSNSAGDTASAYAEMVRYKMMAEEEARKSVEAIVHAKHLKHIEELLMRRTEAEFIPTPIDPIKQAIEEAAKKMRA